MDFTSCSLCPRHCGVDRTAGQIGFCKATDSLKIARYALHHWEEPCISGEKGSGTVFFSHCSLGCIYCQNHDISHNHNGKEISCSELCDIFLSLENDGAHNINLVTPTHYMPFIIKALDSAKTKGLSIPVVYNTGGYEAVDTIKALNGYIDIYMPDFKYFREEYAKRYSYAPDYCETAKKAISEMARQVLPLKYENGIMQRGLIVRHLLLPGMLYDAKKIIDYLYNEYGNDIVYSLMSQYTPLEHISHIPELNKKVGSKEYEILCDYAAKIGIENAYIQAPDSSDTYFIPDFYK